MKKMITLVIIILIVCGSSPFIYNYFSKKQKMNTVVNVIKNYNRTKKDITSQIVTITKNKQKISDQEIDNIILQYKDIYKSFVTFEALSDSEKEKIKNLVPTSTYNVYMKEYKEYLAYKFGEANEYFGKIQDKIHDALDKFTEI